MKRKITVLFCCLICHTGFTGSNTDSTSFKKNEVGIGITPAIVVTFGGSPGYESVFSFTWRRFTEEKFSLRCMPSVTFFRDLLYSSGDLIEDNDTMRIIDYRTTNEKPRYMIKAGFEKYWGKRKAKWFVGVDAFYYFKKEKYNHTRYYYHPDSSTLASGYINYKVDSLDHLYTRETNHHAYGVSPFIGLRVPVAKRWSLIFQGSFLFGYSFDKTDYYENLVFTRKENSHGFVFSMNGLVSDFSVNFLF
ncbi:MAG: hypothetical protein ACOZCO_17655 [Bacteroidota bacterium]